jgi:hypothetical protein
VANPNDINKITVRLAGYRRYETILRKDHPARDLSVTLQREDGEEPPEPRDTLRRREHQP